MKKQKRAKEYKKNRDKRRKHVKLKGFKQFKNLLKNHIAKVIIVDKDGTEYHNQDLLKALEDLATKYNYKVKIRNE